MNTDTLNALGNLAITLAVVIAGLALLYVAVKVGLSWWQSRQVAIAEAGPVTEQMKNLDGLLAEVERRGSRASLLIFDAQQYTQNLVNLIAGIALKAEQLQAEVDQLQAALDAIAGRDPLAIARAAGEVADPHVRTLMLAKVRDTAYWTDTAMLIAAQAGTLNQWQKGYRQFASNLLAEVAQAKGRLAAQQAALELVGTGRPLLQCQANLAEAQTYLQLERHPGLAKAAKQLPAINAGLGGAR